MDAVQRFKCENVHVIFLLKFTICISKTPSFPVEPNVGEILHYPNSQKGMYDELPHGPNFAGNSVCPA